MVKIKTTSINSKKKKSSTQKFKKNKAFRKSQRRFRKKIIRKKKSVGLLSPFNINNNCSFYYDIENFNRYKKFTNDINNYKLSNTEISFLNNIINDINEIKEQRYCNLSISIIPELYENFRNLQIIKKPLNKRGKVIDSIVKEHNDCKNLSLRKIKKVYEEKVGSKISISSISYILKYSLGFRYLKTVVKPKILSNLEFKKKSYFLIRLIYQILKNGMDIIYVDESKIQLKNSNLRIWRPKNDSFNYGSINQGKINLILGVTKNKLIHYELNKNNTNSKIFKNFLNSMLEKININDRKNYVIFMDNARFHKSKDLIKFYKEKSLKILCNVPYESSFDSVELSFRYIKNIIYKKVYNNIEEIITDVKNILESNAFQESLLQQFKETLDKYLYYHNKYIYENLNMKE